MAEAALKGSVAETVKNVYGTLKKKVASWAGGDIQALENAPTSAARRAVVAEVIDAQPTADKEFIQELTAKLVAAIMVVKDDWPIGIDVNYLEAMRIRLGEITVT